MSIATRILVRLKRNKPEYTDAMNAALVEMLSDQQRKIWNWTSADIDIDSMTIARKLNMDIYTASTVLKSIYDMGILTRRCIVDHVGRRFVYRRAS